MVKLNPGLSQILSKVFLTKNMYIVTPAYKILLSLYTKYYFKARSCLTEMNIFRPMSSVQLQLRSAASESIQPVEIIWVDLNSN